MAKHIYWLILGTIIAVMFAVGSGMVLRTIWLVWLTPDIVSVTRGDETYYLITETRLHQGVSLVDSNGEKFYIFSQEKLRLIGDRFLSLPEGQVP